MNNSKDKKKSYFIRKQGFENNGHVLLKATLYECHNLKNTKYLNYMRLT